MNIIPRAAGVNCRRSPAGRVSLEWTFPVDGNRSDRGVRYTIKTGDSNLIPFPSSTDGCRGERVASNPLKQIIADRIRREGPISFAVFMEMALYFPQYGYYMSSTVRFGPNGDYYTSPHLHPVFGGLLAAQILEMHEIMGSPDSFTVLEVGAGHGSLAAGIIAHLLERRKWGQRWRYVIVEKNPLTCEEQKKTLKDYAGLVQWKSSLDAIEPFSGCVVTNELLDAFPVHLVCMADRFREIYVDLDRTGFTEVFGDFSHPALQAYIESYRIPAVSGYRTEANLAIYDFLAEVDRLLSTGFVITIDYGYPARQYYAVERRRGTLLCYHRHKVADNPYRRLGSQDITAHVNFTSLRDWGQQFGLQCLGFCTQGSFLAGLGAGELTAGSSAFRMLSPRETLKIKTLLLDVGSSHQVMIQYRGRQRVENLTGFSISNRVHRL